MTVNGGSPERILERQQDSCVLITYKRRKVFCTRDFPKDCGRPNKAGSFDGGSTDSSLKRQQDDENGPSDAPFKKRLNVLDCVVENLTGNGNYVDAMDSDSVKLVETVLHSSAPEISEEFSKHEATELPKEALVAVFPNTYPLRRRISAIRDFPICFGRSATHVSHGSPPEHITIEDHDFEPSEAFITSQNPEVLDHLGQSRLVGVSYDLGSEMVGMTMVYFSDEEEMLELAKVLESDASEVYEDLDPPELVSEPHHARFVNHPLKTLEHEAIDLSNEALVETLPKTGYWLSRVSAIRDFPPGCGRSSLPIHKEDCLKGVACKGLDHEKTAEHRPFKEAERMNVKEGKAKFQDQSMRKLNGMFSAETLNTVQPQREGDASVPRTFSEIKSEREDLKEKLGMEFVSNMERKSLNRKVLGVFGNANQLQGVKSIGSRGGRVIVQALMAEQNCPWRKNEMAFKSRSKLNGVFLVGTPNKVQAQCERNGGQLGPYSELKSEREDTKGKMGMDFLNNIEEKSKKIKVPAVLCKMNQLQDEKLIGREGSRVIVQALMAAANCPWRQSKRAMKLTSTNATARGEGKISLQSKTDFINLEEEEGWMH